MKKNPNPFNFKSNNFPLDFSANFHHRLRPRTRKSAMNFPVQVREIIITSLGSSFVRGLFLDLAGCISLDFGAGYKCFRTWIIATKCRPLLALVCKEIKIADLFVVASVGALCTTSLRVYSDIESANRKSVDQY